MVDIQTVVPPIPAQRKYQMKTIDSNSIPNGIDHKAEDDRSTTTLSTIVVQAGEHASIVVALLKSVGYMELRIDEMRPGLLAIGGTCEEAATLLNIHEDLMARLRDKEDQVTALLFRADNLSSEKQANEAVVYEDMAKCLNEAWRGLKKQLMLRGYLLKDVLSFYQLAQRHEQLVERTTEAIKALMNAKHENDVATTSKKLEQIINEIIDTTARAIDVGSSVIAQIRVLGQISDNNERPQEILSSCVLIEKVMLGIASEWERIEGDWKNVSEKITVSETSEEISLIEQWLNHAERRIKAVNDNGLRQLLEEGDAHQVRLTQLSADGSADNAKIAHLSGRIEEFLYYVKTRLNRSQRIQTFFQSAQTMLIQITKMAEDMKNANAAMAGELYPLAQQKASTIIAEGRTIFEKEPLSHEEKALVKQRCDELEAKLRLLEELAVQRQSKTQEVSQQLETLHTWYTMEVAPFLATHSDMGGTLNEAVDFLEAHKIFIEEFANREASVISLMNKQTEMTSAEQSTVQELEKNYEDLKEILENRMRIGNNFVQVHKFAKDLESSFDALTSLLDTNRDFSNERLAGQVDSIFHMIDETMEKEKNDMERFVTAAEAVCNIDKKLKVERSVQAAKNFIVDHQHRLTYAKHKWSEWQRKKAEMKKLETTIEEIQMWQEDAWEIIRLLENTKTTSLQDSEGLYRRVKELQQTVGQQTAKLDEMKKREMTENISLKVDDLTRKQQAIQKRVAELDRKVETIYETFMEQEVTKHIRAPQILTSLKDAQVDEGNRIEFVARIEGEPEPKISWLKDGIDVKNNMDYRQDFVNGIASLVIEETFIEDTATYTVRAENEGGVVESSAKLIVKSRSTASSLLEEEKPRFIKQLTNVQVEEGETAHLDCVVVGRPEPEVIWFKEEKTVQEDERIHLSFTGDHCSLTIKKAVPLDTGMYTVKARNICGESTNFCQLKVTSKKQPPPTPPKPTPRHAMPPIIQPTLSTTSCEEGGTASLQVHVKGEPIPRIQWRFNEQPIKTSETIKIEDGYDGWSKLVISPVTLAHSGTYSVYAENEMGETTTAAVLHVQPSTTRTLEYEHMLQEDSYVQLAKPFEKKEERVDEEEIQHFEQRRTQRDYDLSKIESDKRWEGHINEILERPSQPSISEQKESKTAETYIKMVDELMQDALPETTKTTSHSTTTTEYMQKFREEIPPPPPLVEKTTTHVSTELYDVGVYYETTPPPVIEQTTKSTSSEALYHAKVQQTPQPPELYTATKTSEVVERAHAATIRRTPVPETHKATLTGAVSVENIAAIQQPPAPEPHRATITPGTSVENIATIRRSPAPDVQRSSVTYGSSLENIAAIHQATTAPEIHKASVSPGASVENVAAIREAPAPEVHQSRLSRGASVENVAAIGRTPAPESLYSTITSTTVENVAAIRKTSIPESGKASITATPAVESIGAIRQSEPAHPQTAIKSSGGMLTNVAQINVPVTKPDRQEFTTSAVPVDRIDDIVVPKYVPQVTTYVSQTVTDEGHIYHIDQNLEPSVMTTRERRISGSVAAEETKELVVRDGDSTVVVREHIIDEEVDSKQRLLEEQEWKLQQREASAPVVSKVVQQTTCAEGWVQHEHDEIAHPQAVQTTKRYETELSESRTQQQLAPAPHHTVSTTQKSEEEEARRSAAYYQSRIPQVSKRTTTTTTADGFVQDVYDQIAQPVKLTSTTKKEEEAQWQKAASHTQLTMPQTKVDERTEVVDEQSRYRDSFIAASEGEGFWTDGACTTSPSPPPLPKHRSLFEHEYEKKETKEFASSNASTKPEFIRGFHKDYTVDEGGCITIDCMLVGNPRPKVQFFFNEKEIKKGSKFCDIVAANDTYSIVIDKARLEHSGYYKIVAENIRGQIESLTILHVRPQSLIKYQQNDGYNLPYKKVSEYRSPTEHTTITEEFAMFEYEQRRPQKHETTRLVTPPPAKRFQTHKKEEETLEQYDVEERKPAGHPPHFTQTLVSTVASEGESAKFEGIVTGWPTPTIEWSKDGVPLTNIALPHVDIAYIGGRVLLFFKQCDASNSGKYMCTARNSSGVATSSAQLVVRPRAIAPDFIERLISKEVVEGDQLKWTVRVTGDPKPMVTWLRDGIEIPDCDEVRIFDEGNGIHSLLIVRVEMADTGQFTCLAENVAGEARSTADLVVRSANSRPGSYFHVTKVTQEKQVAGEQPVRNTAFTVQNSPRQSAML